MSVLNQMLRDLEQRQAPARPELALAAIEAPASPLLAALSSPTLPLAKPLEPTPLAALAHSAMAQQAAAGTAQTRVPGMRLRAVVWSVVFACVAAATAAIEWAERQQEVRAPVPLGAATFAGVLAGGIAAAPDTAARDSRDAAPATAAPATPAAASQPAAAVTAAPAAPARSAAPPLVPPAARPQPAIASPATASATNDTAPAVRRSAASEDDPQANLARAAALIARGRASEAKELLNAVLARQPQQADARAALAALQAEAGDRRAALATLLAGAALDPQRFALPAAQLQNELGDAGGARQTLERVPPAHRSGAQHALAAGLALAAQQPAAAIAAYQRALASDESNAVWWVGLALAHEADGNAPAAHAAFARAARSPALEADLRAFVTHRLAALPAAVRAAAADIPVVTLSPR